MAMFQIGVRTSGVAITTAGIEIRASASRITLVHELEIMMAAATASVVGIGRPANTPAGGTTNAPPSADVDDAAVYGGSIILAGWTTAPTAPASFLYRVNLPGTLGATYRLTRPVEIARGGSLVLWNITANGVADVNLRIEDVGL